MSLVFEEPSKVRHPIGVTTGTVMTVTGPIPVDELGVTLMHEHILLDGSKSWKCPCHPDEIALSEVPVTMDIIGDLRMNPYMNRDNVSLDNMDLALSELNKFRDLGGHTVVDTTTLDFATDPKKLARISKMSGLKIVRGTGFYLEYIHPDWLKDMDLDAVTQLIIDDVGGGETQPEVMAGIIGEVGVSKDFTDAEKKSLRASARASKATGVALTIHLPGWERLAHQVLDIVEDEGADLKHTVLCHMNPSHDDLVYQVSLAKRGAFLEYDMIGMDYYYADQNAQSPSDEQNAKAINTLVDMGFADRILLSQDVFLKIMLTRFGGFGYGHVLKNFVPRLKRLGLTQKTIDQMLIDNPKSVFVKR